MPRALDQLLNPDIDADRLLADPEADALLQGAVDMHVHPGPSPFPRRIGILDAARDAADNGFAAIVVKSHHLSMQTDVLALRGAGLSAVPIDVYAGIALNRTVGGLNPYAVEVVLGLGGRVVWFPTISSKAHIDFHHTHHDSRFPTSKLRLREHEPLSLLDDDGALRPEVRDILDVIAREEAVLNAGHLPADEIDALLTAAGEAGVTRMVVSHPTFIVDATPQRCAEWVRKGATIEHCLAMAVGRPQSSLTMAVLQPYLDAAGVRHTIFSSDLGQAAAILPVTGFRRMARRLIDHGFDTESIRTMFGGNAKDLLKRSEA
ncbi:DUF6282 family protein [Dactylosporangium sp. CA-092794]|uniref:DUF6282 family protein n=1 Tax=Dactylosporangium sp. CA-092794 TaxID=3239929 RepID=UPI003D8D8A86